MNNSRRSFVKLSAASAAALAFSPSFGNSWLADLLGDDARRIKKFGLQLWTLRDSFPKDVKGVLKDVADSGYHYVESFEGQNGIFWGMKNTEFKKYISDLGMTMHSSHIMPGGDFEKKANEAAEIGLKYLIYAWEGPSKTIDDYKKLAEEFNKNGEICKKAGLRFAFHNHDYSFTQSQGQFPQDVLMQGTDASLVDYQMDIYWVVAAGQDPEEWMKKYPNRFRLCHIKDRSKNPVADNGKNSVDLGTGSINYSKILRTAIANGMQYHIVEQEAYPNGTPLEAARVDAAFMKKLRA